MLVWILKAKQDFNKQRMGVQLRGSQAGCRIMTVRFQYEAPQGDGAGWGSMGSDDSKFSELC